MSLNTPSFWEHEKINSRENINSLLQKKEQQFIQKYKISKEKLDSLIIFSTKNTTIELKEQLSLLVKAESLETNDLITIHQNFQEILNIREQVQNEIASLNKEILRETIDQTITKENSLTWKFFSPTFLTRINNPENILDEIQAILFTTWESLAWCGKLTKDVIVWLIQSPSHILQIIKWKAKHDGVEI